MKVRIWQASLLAVIVFAVALTWATSETAQVSFKTDQGIITNIDVAVVTTQGGKTLQRFAGEPDGIYDVPAVPGQKIAFELDNPTGPSYVETVMPDSFEEIVLVNLPTQVTPPTQAANDLCDNAILVGVPSVTAGSTSDATFDNVGTCGTSNTAPGVWYKVVGTGATMTASLCTGTAYDSKITVFDGACDALGCIGGNDDFCGLQSQLSWCSQAGVEYLILVHGYSSAVGSFELTVTDDGEGCQEGACCSCSAPPFNCGVGTASDCAQLGGQYAGDNTSCAALANDPQLYGSAPGLPISGATPVVSDTITVPDMFPIGDVNIQLEISHTYIGDLSIDVTHNGSTQNIWDNRCSYSDNINATADDQGTESLCSNIGAGPVDQVFYSVPIAALGLLSAYNGMDASGDWTITVTDTYPSLDDGVLNAWAVVIDGIGESACPDQNNETCFLCPEDPGGGGCDEEDDDENGTVPANEFSLTDETEALQGNDYRRTLGRR